MTGIELGCRRGGLSAYLALKGCRMVCSDISGYFDDAQALHRYLGVDTQITYARVDALSIPFSSESLDLVSLKSVLGALGVAGNGMSPQEQAVAEALRVLKRGGRLLFAENLAATVVHKALRKHCVPWGESWHYLTLDELVSLMEGFARVEFSTCGFLALLGRREWQRTMLHAVDTVLMPLVPTRARYVAFGIAVK